MLGCGHDIFECVQVYAEQRATMEEYVCGAHVLTFYGGQSLRPQGIQIDHAEEDTREKLRRPALPLVDTERSLSPDTANSSISSPSWSDRCWRWRALIHRLSPITRHTVRVYKKKERERNHLSSSLLHLHLPHTLFHTYLCHSEVVEPRLSERMRQPVPPFLGCALLHCSHLHYFYNLGQYIFTLPQSDIKDYKLNDIVHPSV